MADERAKKVAKVLAKTAGASIGASLTGSPVAGAALGSVSEDGLEQVLSFAYSSFRSRRTDEFWQWYLQHLGTMTPEAAVTEAVLQAAQDPRFQERVYHVLNAVWAAIDNDVLPCLAYLAADYQATGQPSDARFKQLARFLQDTTKAQLEILRKLTPSIESAFVASTRVGVIIGAQPGELIVRPEGEKDRSHESTTVRHGLTGDRMVLRRLLNELLADELPLINAVTALTFTRDQFRDLHRYVVRPLV